MKVITGKRIAMKTKKYLALHVRGFDLINSLPATDLSATRIVGFLFIIEIIISDKSFYSKRIFQSHF
jgi:hypothetical protein